MLCKMLFLPKVYHFCPSDLLIALAVKHFRYIDDGVICLSFAAEYHLLPFFG